MKFLKIILVVIVLIGAMVGISFLSTGSKSVISDNSVVDNPYAKELLDSINKIDSQNRWDKPKVEDMRQSVELHRKESLIEEDIADELLYNLDLVYINQLNLATEDFFKNSCEDKYVGELEKEIDAFSKNKDYAVKLKKSRDRITAYKRLRYFVWNSNNYIQNEDFDFYTSKEILKKISSYKENPVTVNCTKLTHSLGKFGDELENKHIVYLRRKVQQMEDNSTTTLDEINNFVTELEKFPDLEIYPSSRSYLKGKMKPLINRLVDLYLEKKEQQKQQQSNEV